MVIVIVPPGLDQPPCVAERAEQRLVQQLVPQPGIKALRENVLHRLAGLDVAPRNAPLVRPGEDRVRGQLRAVVGKHASGGPRQAMMRSSSRATRAAEIDVSGIRPRHSRVQSLKITSAPSHALDGCYNIRFIGRNGEVVVHG